MSTGLSLALGLALVGGGSAFTSDYWDLAILNDNAFGSTTNELVHGTSQQHDLQANTGLEGMLVPDRDWYIVLNYPTSSYEAVIDGTGGDIGPLSFERVASDGATILQFAGEASPAGGGGFSRALRWENTAIGGTDKQFIRVQSGGCNTDCAPKDQYHIRFYETTVSVPRFNNTSSQVTVLIMQNSTRWSASHPISGTIYFWDTAGALLGSQTFSLIGRAALVLNTSTVPGAAGAGGTITVTHNGGFGSLTMKSVAVEPATGFSFDSPGLYKPY